MSVSSCAKRSSLAALLLLLPASAHAAPNDPPRDGKTTADAAAPPGETKAVAAAASSAEPVTLEAVAAELERQKADLAKQKEDLDQQRAELAAQKKAAEDSQALTSDLEAKVDAAASAVNDNDWTSKFKIYGFTDVGVQRVWAGEHNAATLISNSVNATSFVIGNLNLYFDAQPVKDWRSLVEVRFTNAPHGEILSFGGLAGTFARRTTQQTDPNASSFSAQMWGGYTVIERAHIDWTGVPYLKVRVGNFFTPFGIWNVDHGSPTLIATQLPAIIQLRLMPLRQTGVQVYGSAFKGDWELGYIATVSNGRQELSNFAFDDNRGFGGRLYANNESGAATIKLGASFYTGRVRDQQVNLTNLTPFTIERKSTFDYREVVGGADVAVDVGRTRIRSEVAVTSIAYADGKRAPALLASTARASTPDTVVTSGYATLAHALPFAPIELFLNGEVIFGRGMYPGDLVLAPGVGMNVRFTKATMWKSQATVARGFDTRGGGAQDAAADAMDCESVFSRLVLVF